MISQTCRSSKSATDPQWCMVHVWQAGQRAAQQRRHSRAGWWQRGGGGWPCRARPTPPASCAMCWLACSRTRFPGRRRRPTTSSAEKPLARQVCKYTVLCVSYSNVGCCWVPCSTWSAAMLHGTFTMDNLCTGLHATFGRSCAPLQYVTLMCEDPNL